MINELSVQELKKLLDQGEDLVLIDVREKNERELVHIGGWFIPLREILLRAHEIPRNKKVVIYCRSGQRSALAINRLQEQFGFSNLYNLKGGILAWATEIDPSLPKY